MNLSRVKPIIYRVLIIDDESNWHNFMQESLQYFSLKNNITLEIEIVENCEDARKIIGKELFHAVAIDLRLPEKPGGVLISQPQGIELAIELTKTSPLISKHIYTAWAAEHALKLYRESACIESPPPIWDKASSDNEEGENRYTQKEWAQRILTLILPRSASLKVPLANERNILREQLLRLSPLGESVDFAVNAGRNHLPQGMARHCAVMHRWLETGDARYESHAFMEALFLAETIQHWLWAQAGAWLTAMNLTQKINWPIQNSSGNTTRAGMEKSLRAMLRSIAESEQEDWAATWLSHLHIRTDGKGMNIVDALAIIRTLRNQHFHESCNEELPWEQLALPLRVVLDAAAYQASYPILSRPIPAADNRWRFTMLKGEATPPPEEEWTLTSGELGKSERFTPLRDDLTLYQLWPCPDGSLGLLKLWPFVDQRINMQEGRNTIWLLYGVDGRNPKRLWERSAQDGRENCNPDVQQERLQVLKALGAVSKVEKP